MPDSARLARLLRWQSLLAAAAGLAAAPFGAGLALAALLGGGVALAVNGVGAWLVLGPYRADRPGSLLGRFYAAEVVRLITAGVAFAALFAWAPGLSPAALIGSFLLAQVGAPLLLHRAGHRAGQGSGK